MTFRLSIANRKKVLRAGIPFGLERSGPKLRHEGNGEALPGRSQAREQEEPKLA